MKLHDAKLKMATSKERVHIGHKGSGSFHNPVTEPSIGRRRIVIDCMRYSFQKRLYRRLFKEDLTINIPQSHTTILGANGTNKCKYIKHTSWFACWDER